MGRMITSTGGIIDDRLVEIMIYPLSKDELYSTLTSLAKNMPNKHYYAIAEILADLDKDNPAYPIIDGLNNYGCKYVK